MAVLVKIRELYSSQEVPPVLELQCAVNLVAFIKSVCKKVLSHSTPSSDLNRYMALEISWIMVNTAFGPKELIEDLFFDKDDQ